MIISGSFVTRGLSRHKKNLRNVVITYFVLKLQNNINDVFLLV